MKKAKSFMILYAVISFLSIGVFLACDLIRLYIDTAHLEFVYPVLKMELPVWTPIIGSVLFFIKLALGKNVSKRFSIIINAIATVLLLVVIIGFYPNVSMWYLITLYQATTVMVCLQICALVYGLFVRKTEKVREL